MGSGPSNCTVRNKKYILHAPNNSDMDCAASIGDHREVHTGMQTRNTLLTIGRYCLTAASQNECVTTCAGEVIQLAAHVLRSPEQNTGSTNISNSIWSFITQTSRETGGHGCHGRHIDRRAFSEDTRPVSGTSDLKHAI